MSIYLQKKNFVGMYISKALDIQSDREKWNKSTILDNNIHIFTYWDEKLREFFYHGW
jgi:hypothetical protein